MQKIKCELCGSNDLKKIDGEYICQYCGAKYSLEEAKKLIVEISGTVKIDNSDKIANFETLATRALDDKDYKKADEYYTKLLELDSENWKYIYQKGFCEAQLGNYTAIIKGCKTAFDVIKEKNVVIEDIEKIKFQMARDILEIETKSCAKYTLEYAKKIMNMDYTTIISYRDGLIECVDSLEYASELIEEFIEQNDDIKHVYISILKNIVSCVEEIIKKRRYTETSLTGNRYFGKSSIEPSLKQKYDNIMDECNSKLRDLGVDASVQKKDKSSKSFFKTVVLVFFGVLLLAGLAAIGEMSGNL